MKRLLAIAALALLAAPAFSQTLNFTVETTTSGGSAVIPRLTWSTTPAASGCTASGGWTGAKAAAGVELLAAINATKSFVLNCTWPGDTVGTVTWVAPTLNTDGTPYTNPGGFRIVYGQAPDNLDRTIYLQDPAARSWVSPTLAPGPWYFGVITFSAQGLESPVSNIASKTLTAATNQSRTLDVTIRFPAAATGVAAK